jgi:hypothetical protein
MKSKLSISGLAVALIAFFMFGVHGQQSTGKTDRSEVTTNWIGNLVVAQIDRGDPITRGPVPTTVRNVQVGLRSDGVLIWKKAEKQD